VALLGCGAGQPLSLHEVHRAQNPLFQRRKIVHAQGQAPRFGHRLLGLVLRLNLLLWLCLFYGI
jgi:hypothetical protein